MKYVFALMIALLALAACGAEDETTPLSDVNGLPEPTAPIDDFDDVDIDDDWDGSAGMGEPDVHIVMDGGMFWFEVDGVRNPDIVVQQGDLVRIDLTSVAGRHDVVIDELGVASELIDAGESTSVEFVATTPGEFDYYCGFMEHREQGMVGTFIVE